MQLHKKGSNKGVVRPVSLPSHSIYVTQKHVKTRSATQHKAGTHQVCSNEMLLCLCASTPVI